MRKAVLVVFGHGKLEVHLGAAVGIFERDVRRDLVVLPGRADLAVAPSRAMPAARKAGEQVPQIEIVEGKVAAASSLNFSSAPGSLETSGWYLRASFRYALLISSGLALRSTPITL
jgi:hypothetical protein